MGAILTANKAARVREEGTFIHTERVIHVDPSTREHVNVKNSWCMEA